MCRVRHERSEEEQEKDEKNRRSTSLRSYLLEYVITAQIHTYDTHIND